MKCPTCERFLSEREKAVWNRFTNAMDREVCEDPLHDIADHAAELAHTLEMIRDAARDAVMDDVTNEWVLETAKRADRALLAASAMPSASRGGGPVSELEILSAMSLPVKRPSEEVGAPLDEVLSDLADLDLPEWDIKEVAIGLVRIGILDGESRDEGAAAMIAASYVLGALEALQIIERRAA